MRLFKKIEDYTIIADDETRFRVYEFAEKFDPIYSEIVDGLAAFSFRTNQTSKEMFNKLKKVFEPEFNVVPGNHIFCVVKKIEL